MAMPTIAPQVVQATGLGPPNTRPTMALADRPERDDPAQAGGQQAGVDRAGDQPGLRSRVEQAEHREVDGQRGRHQANLGDEGHSGLVGLRSRAGQVGDQGLVGLREPSRGQVSRRDPDESGIEVGLGDFGQRAAVEVGKLNQAVGIKVDDQPVEPADLRRRSRPPRGTRGAVAASGRLAGSHLPPGNSQTPGIGEPGGRRRIR